MIRTLIGGPRMVPPLSQRQDGRGKPVICQINGRWDEQRGTKLPAQCCGKKADQIYKCEVIGPHEHCQVGEHTIIHERLGNGHPCSAIEFWVDNGGLNALIREQARAMRGER